LIAPAIAGERKPSLQLGIPSGVSPSSPNQIALYCMHTLKFSKGNAKLSKRLIFNLPAGHTCPNAGVCRTMADKNTGKITDAPRTDNAMGLEFRCFAAMAETRPAVRAARWHNFNTIKQVMLDSFDTEGSPTDAIEKLLLLNIAWHTKGNNQYPLCRVHESGDFFNAMYFNAWLKVAAKFNDMKFYAYTKQLEFWLGAHSADLIPPNFYLTASMGGDQDYLLDQYPEVFQRVAVVVYTEEEADQLGFEIDHDDSHCFGNVPFALLVHNNQRKGSDAAKALAARRRQGSWTGYSN